MLINVNFPTGNWFEDGTAEIGKVLECSIETWDDFDNILDDIPDGTEYFLTNKKGNKINEYDIHCLLY